MADQATLTRSCSRCGSRAKPTGKTTAFGRLAEYKCENGHVYIDSPRILRAVFGRGLPGSRP